MTSQLTSKVLVGRLPTKSLMVGGSILAASGLFVLSQLHAGSSYAHILPGLVLVGAGMGTSFVSLTTAALHGIAPADSGAASGLINVMQQLGAALGLAVLVTVFDTVTSSGRSAVVHGMDIAFAAGGLFSLAALAIIILGVRSPSAAAEVAPIPIEAELEPAA